jgi:hypothetical protein
VDQFKTEKLDVSNVNIDDPVHYKFYSDYLSRTEALPDKSDGVEAKDRAIYEKFVQQVQAPVQVRNATVDSYRRWLETGRMHVQPLV